MFCDTDYMEGEVGREGGREGGREASVCAHV